jgi:hypothetical protein
LKGFKERNKRAYRLILWGLLMISLLALTYLAPTLVKPQYYSTDDFFPFWAAGKLNLAGQNPYDPQNKESLQVAVGGYGATTYRIAIMLNPPWAVTLVMPFGLLSYPISRIAWLFISIAFIVISAQLCWRFYNGSPQKRWLAWVALFVFSPMIAVLEVGQSSVLVLLGVTLFLYFILYQKNDWAAGAALALVFVKPQVTLIFLLAVFLWVIQQKRWRILGSSLLTITVLILIAMLFNPSIFSQYLGMARAGYLSERATPTIGAYLRYFWLGVDQFWLQFIPPMIAVAWFIWYWQKHRSSWTWMHELPILLLVSQVSAPYTYTYDLVILLPVIIQATVLLASCRKCWMTALLVAVFIMINILDLLLHMRFNDFWFIWIAPSIFLWFLIVRWQFRQSEIDTPISIPG